MAVYFFVELQLERRYNFVGTIGGHKETVELINSGVITAAELEGFIDDLRENVGFPFT